MIDFLDILKKFFLFFFVFGSVFLKCLVFIVSSVLEGGFFYVFCFLVDGFSFVWVLGILIL